MTIEEVLLTVLTVAVVMLILIIVAVLVITFMVLKKIKKAANEIQKITEKGTVAAEKIAPLSAVAVGVLQVVKILMKRRK